MGPIEHLRSPDINSLPRSAPKVCLDVKKSNSSEANGITLNSKAFSVSRYLNFNGLS